MFYEEYCFLVIRINTKFPVKRININIFEIQLVSLKIFLLFTVHTIFLQKKEKESIHIGIFQKAI